MLDTSEFSYRFDAVHLGAIASGPGAAQALTDLAAALDRRPLVVRREEGAIWAWLGSRKQTNPDELQRSISRHWPGRLSLALGEPGEGLACWRLSHRQAKAALPFALCGSEPVHYADVALLASVLRDDLLTASLRQLYLAPLAQERDGGAALRETLRAYFKAQGNISSSSAVLGVNRHTVTKRLRTIEERLGRPLSSCMAEMDAALRVEALRQRH